MEGPAGGGCGSRARRAGPTIRGTMRVPSCLIVIILIMLGLAGCYTSAGSEFNKRGIAYGPWLSWVRIPDIGRGEAAPILRRSRSVRSQQLIGIVQEAAAREDDQLEVSLVPSSRIP